MAALFSFALNLIFNTQRCEKPSGETNQTPCVRHDFDLLLSDGWARVRPANCRPISVPLSPLRGKHHTQTHARTIGGHNSTGRRWCLEFVIMWHILSPSSSAMAENEWGGKCLWVFLHTSELDGIYFSFFLCIALSHRLETFAQCGLFAQWVIDRRWAVDSHEVDICYKPATGDHHHQHHEA